MLESDYYQYQNKIGWLAGGVSMQVRKRMLDSFMAALSPTEKSTILDVGVTCDSRSDSNFFEKFYPFKKQITAVGLEDASSLEDEFPGLTYLKADALALPFENKSFDIAVSWAVIEHVGCKERQEKYLSELLRVSKKAFITTPNRWYPLEFHTVMPFLHWLPPEIFRKILKALRMDFYASVETLNLLDEKTFMALLPEGAKVKTLHFRLLGPISHLVFLIEAAATK